MPARILKDHAPAAKITPEAMLLDQIGHDKDQEPKVPAPLPQ